MPPKIKATAVNAVIGAVYHDQVFGLGGRRKSIIWIVVIHYGLSTGIRCCTRICKKACAVDHCL